MVKISSLGIYQEHKVQVFMYCLKENVSDTKHLDTSSKVLL